MVNNDLKNIYRTKSKHIYYIYMIECANSSYYTGITTDLTRRFNEHRLKIGAKYTKAFRANRIRAVWKTKSIDNSRSIASKLEYYIKKLNRNQKEILISNDKIFKYYFDNLIDIKLYKRLSDVEIDKYMNRGKYA